VSNYDQIEPFLAKLHDTIAVSAQTPLLSNLNMCENIALIREVHQHLPQKISMLQAKEALKRIGLEDICQKRLHQCTPIEIFYVMLIRAMMSEAKIITVITPFSFVKKLSNFSSVLDTLYALDFQQEVIVVDIFKNLHHYRDKRCIILK